MRKPLYSKLGSREEAAERAQGRRRFTSRVDKGANRSDTKHEFVGENMVLGCFQMTEFLTVLDDGVGDRTTLAGNGL